MKKRNTVGLDMGDKSHTICVLDWQGQVVERDEVANTAVAIRKRFAETKPCLVALEAGTHSGWVSRILEELGHEVLVGNPRKLRAIWDNAQKNDVRDAEMLARIARFDPQLLHPIRHRGPEAQCDLAAVKARDELVRVRTALIAHVRGLVKTAGDRLPKCSPECFHLRAAKAMPSELAPALERAFRTWRAPATPLPAKPATPALPSQSAPRVLIVDDVISTGGSLKALDALAEQTQCTIVGQAAVLAEGDAAERKDIIFLEPLPLFFH